MNSIFQQPWWLDAVAPGQWAEVLVHRGAEVAARLPYVCKRRYGLTLLSMPPLTQTLGPWLRHSEAKYTHALAEEKELLTSLIEQLPRYDFFLQNLSPDITNWLPFYWRGFQQTTCYTYRLEDLSDLARTWDGFRENIRREIRKAKKSLVVQRDLPLETLLELSQLTFARQGLTRPQLAPVLRRLDAACAARNCRLILGAEDAAGRVHGAAYIVWDARAAYYLIGGADPELRASGVSSLLLWEAIQAVSGRTRCFDFEGSMIESVERFFRAFGARQVPFFRVTRMSRRMAALSALRDFLGAFSVRR